MNKSEYNALNNDEKLIYCIQSSKVNLIKECFETLYACLGDDDINIGYKNYLVNSDLNMLSSVNGGAWLECVESMGRWYGDNIDFYQGGPDNDHPHGKHGYSCPLLNGRLIYDDCSGFVQACLNYYGINNFPFCLTTTNMNTDTFDKIMSENGFIHLTGIFNPTNSQPGDILCGGPGTHTAIYGGNNLMWDWGNNRYRGKHGGMPIKWYSYKYINCWRKI